MDILIKNMEMPSCCYDCFMALSCEERDKADTIDRPKGLFNRRINTCPLIPVPEHGDLIDRDNEIKEWELTKRILLECGQKQTFEYRKTCVVISALSQAEVVLERT